MQHLYINGPEFNLGTIVGVPLTQKHILVFPPKLKVDKWSLSVHLSKPGFSSQLLSLTLQFLPKSFCATPAFDRGEREQLSQS